MHTKASILVIVAVPLSAFNNFEEKTRKMTHTHAELLPSCYCLLERDEIDAILLS